jgi:prevent-host-death family protein
MGPRQQPPGSGDGRTIGAFEAKTRFGELLAQVEEGASFLITRRGVPVARLVPVKRGSRDPKALLEAFKAFQKAHPLEGITTKELINEGRKR